jgi:hypothetical protein
MFNNNIKNKNIPHVGTIPNSNIKNRKKRQKRHHQHTAA